MTPPAEEYRSRLRQRQQIVQQLSRGDARVATLRGLVFAGFLALAWAVMTGRGVPELALLAPLLLFAALVLIHNHLRTRRQLVERSVNHYREALDRLKNRWQETPGTGERYRDSGHPYANDLDLFGPGSVFQLVNRSQTRLGEDCLAQWLKTPAGRQEILDRQAAVAELREQIDLREELDVLHPALPDTLDQNHLTRWVNEPHQELPRSALLLGGLFSVLMIAGLLYKSAGGPWTLFLGPLAAQILLLWLHRDALHRETHSAETAREGLRVAAQVLQLITQQQHAALRLKNIQQRLEVEGRGPAQQLRRLESLINLLSNSLRNQLFAPVAILFGLQLQLIARLHAWRRRIGQFVPDWFQAAGEWEALLSLSGHAYEFEDSVFPEIAESTTCFEGQGLRHPILVRQNAVANDLALDSQRKLLLVSGSNMSGKSTLLRTVGVNAVLALAGGTAHASYIRLSVLQVGAAMRVNDSLREGKSLFYTVVTRLKEIVDLTRQELPLLYLLDEILPGTNSHDRRLGAEGVLRSLIQRDAIGLVTTHDLALTRIVDSLEGRAENVHFEDHLEDGEMSFDYRLRPGVVQKSNALELMKMIGLEVGEHSDLDRRPDLTDEAVPPPRPTPPSTD